MIRSTLAATALAALAFTGHAGVLTFEGSTLTGASRILDQAIADAHGPSLVNYAGYDWLGMVVAKPNVSIGRPQQITGFEEDEGRMVPLTTPVNAGFHRSLVSGDTIAYTQSFNGSTSLMGAVKAQAGGPNFDFNSVYLTSGWRDNIDVVVTGWRDGQVVYTVSLVIGDDGPQLTNFGFLNIDEIRFNTSGGTFLYGNSNQLGGYANPGGAFSTPTLAFDNMDIAPTAVSQVPEPASLALMGMGLLGLVGTRRRQPG